MEYPDLIPIPKEYGQFSIPIGQSLIRFVTYDGGDTSRETLVYTVPMGKKVIVWEIYRIVSRGTIAPSGYAFKTSEGITFSYIDIVTHGGGLSVYGSLNLINGNPLTLKEGEKIYHTFGSNGGANSALYMSVLIEEKDKTAT